MLSSIVNEESICFIKSECKSDALGELLQILYNNNKISDIQQIHEMIMKREELMSTGIGFGIAVAHVRFDGIDEPIVAMGIAKKGIEDYASLDNKIVKIVFLVIVNKGAHNEYIKLLAKIATIVKDEKFRNELLDKNSIADVYSYLKAHS